MFINVDITKDITLFLQKANKSNEDLLYLKSLLQNIEVIEKLLNHIPNELSSQFLNQITYRKATKKEVIITFGNLIIIA